MRKAFIFVILAGIIFGTMEVALKIGGSSMDPFQLTYLRFTIGGLMLLPFGVKEIRKRELVLSARDYLVLAVIGTIGVVISMVMFQLGVMYSNAATAAVLFCINPFFTMIFAHFFSDEKLDRQKALVLIIALIGIMFILRPWDVQEGNTVYGMVLSLLAAVFFGVYTVASKGSVQKMGTIAQTSISFLMGSFILMIITFVSGRPVFDGIIGNIPILLYTGLLVTGGGYYCFFKAIELSDATTGSFAFFIKPAVAPVIAVIILREQILWNTVVGIAFVLAASLLKIYKREK